MSSRNFARVFRKEYGELPAAFVDRLRVETGRGLLTDTDLTLDEVAVRCGFSDSGSLCRAFIKQYGIAPSTLRP